MAGLKVIYTQWCTRHTLPKHKDLEKPVVQVQSIRFSTQALKSEINVDSIWLSESDSTQSSQYDRSPKISPTTSRFDVRPALVDKDIHPALRTSSEAAPRYDYVPYLLKVTEPQDTFKQLDSVYRTPRWFREDDLATFFNDASDDDDDPPPVTPPKSPKRYAKPEAKPRQRSVDFTLIDRNRQAQAAETGQLKARAPKHLSVDIKAASVLALSRSTTLPNLEPSALPEVVPFAQFVQRTSSSPTTWRDRNAQVFNEAATGEVSPLSPAFQITSAQGNAGEVSPMSATFQTTPAPKEPNPTRTMVQPLTEAATFSPYVPPTTRPRNISIPPAPIALGPPIPSETGPFELEDTSPKPDVSPQRQWFEKVSSIEEQVIRGRNSGFEILKPGSLSERGRHPPISLLNRTGDDSRGRKLQKKRRNSMDSQVSIRSTSSNRSRLSFSSLFHRSKDDLSTR